jgi:hypothetical protein
MIRKSGSAPGTTTSNAGRAAFLADLDAPRSVTTYRDSELVAEVRDVDDHHQVPRTSPK